VGRSTLVATTSPPLLAEADEVVVLRDGRVVSTGSHRDLLDRDDHYVRLVRRSESL
jgi:ABC-type multidrug transport system fused ATPase/permease subunit